MRCDEARELMHEALDGSAQAREALAGHLAECQECAAKFAALERVQDAVAATVAWEPPEDRLERATVAALALAGERRRTPWAALAAAAAVLLAFGLGLCAGRSAWPREVVRVERVPQVVERIVEREVPVEVPVVQERVVVRDVVREVPVVRERIVYRDRPAAPGEATLAAPPEPVMPEIREERIVARPMAITITQSEEVMPAPVANEEPPADDEVGAGPDAPDGDRLALEMSASESERVVQ